MKNRASYKEQSQGLGAVFQGHNNSSKYSVDTNFVYMSPCILKKKTKEINTILEKSIFLIKISISGCS